MSDESDPRAYVRLAARLRRERAEGTLTPGMPTPSITTLSQDAGHARQTCAKALASWKTKACWPVSLVSATTSRELRRAARS
jgi:DNA-binding transcriptional MocR family regulator